MYRHVSLLAEAGVLEVAGEQRVRGAVERHYRLRREQTRIDADAAASMSLDDHRRGFTAAMAAVHAEFSAYLDRDGADPTADLVGYRQGVLWLSHDELAEMMDDMREVLAARWGNKPAPGRTPPPGQRDRVSRRGPAGRPRPGVPPLLRHGTSASCDPGWKGRPGAGNHWCPDVPGESDPA
ncbi:hypothetical protein [Microtetraspora fusca]|uniref:hypothetical protein n=1 Tax=Microtetraspora fusca TaxID=1997 RepID=UPI000836057E